MVWSYFALVMVWSWFDCDLVMVLSCFGSALHCLVMVWLWFCGVWVVVWS